MFNKKDNMSMTERLFWLSKLNQSGGSGGGGGGGDTSNVMIVPAELDSDTYTLTLGKTWREITEALSGGKVVFINWTEAVSDIYGVDFHSDQVLYSHTNDPSFIPSSDAKSPINGGAKSEPIYEYTLFIKLAYDGGAGNFVFTTEDDPDGYPSAVID